MNNNFYEYAKNLIDTMSVDELEQSLVAAGFVVTRRDAASPVQPEPSKDLEACPFCDSSTAPEVADNLQLGIHTDIEFYGYTVFCSAKPSKGGCGANCGWHESESAAIYAWHRRGSVDPTCAESDTVAERLAYVVSVAARTSPNLDALREKYGIHVIAPGVSTTPGPIEASGTAKVAPLVTCAADRDGECRHPQCPQLRDGEPAKSLRHCPLDTHSENDQ